MTGDPGLAAEPWRRYERSSFDAGGLAYERLRRVAPGRATVLLLTELPGLGPRTQALADFLYDAGFSVVLPVLLPPLVAAPGRGEMLRNVRRVCVSREFAALAAREDRPVTAWLLALAADEAAASGRPVGVVGMCLTGAFALAMAVDPVIGAAVASQPSVPPPYLRWSADLAMSADTFEALADRADDGFCVRALRFSRDPVSHGRRLRFIAATLPGAQVVEVPARWPWQHSVLTSAVSAAEGTALRAALDGTIDYLRAQLEDGGADASREGAR
jgi:dienelactone hydrolase